ncbi:cupin domain-containing protein [Conexibacter sp. SYSU D00693]|uniref:cupin domain-containing protein n=1 Tax=Conexibacter sp. SYSU D00693 TaxID=2812560 RepID=UPI00196B1FFC|nr:cupin domain-containing protein [Conexibacter sp. SYSU D00693]
MERFNVLHGEGGETDPEDPPGFQAAMRRLGPGVGARETGASVYDLPPGQAVCPYHWEAAEEEWLLVVRGRPSVRTPSGEHQLEEGDVVFFAAAPEGAHKVFNAGDEPARVLLWSSVRAPAATFYPDSGKVGVYPGQEPRRLLFRQADAVDYYDGETG